MTVRWKMQARWLGNCLTTQIDIEDADGCRLSACHSPESRACQWAESTCDRPSPTVSTP